MKEPSTSKDLDMDNRLSFSYKMKLTIIMAQQAEMACIKNSSWSQTCPKVARGSSLETSDDDQRKGKKKRNFYKGLIYPSLWDFHANLSEKFVCALHLRRRARKVKILVEYLDLIPTSTMTHDVAKVEHFMYSSLHVIVYLENTLCPQSLPCSVHLYQSLIPTWLSGGHGNLF